MIFAVDDNMDAYSFSPGDGFDSTLTAGRLTLRCFWACVETQAEMSIINIISFFIMVILFHKHKINCTNNEQKSKNVVPVQVLALEEDVGYNGKHDQTDAFLNHLELYEGEWASIAI